MPFLLVAYVLSSVYRVPKYAPVAGLGGQAGFLECRHQGIADERGGNATSQRFSELDFQRPPAAIKHKLILYTMSLVRGRLGLSIRAVTEAVASVEKRCPLPTATFGFFPSRLYSTRSARNPHASIRRGNLRQRFRQRLDLFLLPCFSFHPLASWWRSIPAQAVALGRPVCTVDGCPTPPGLSQTGDQPPSRSGAVAAIGSSRVIASETGPRDRMDGIFVAGDEWRPLRVRLQEAEVQAIC